MTEEEMATELILDLQKALRETLDLLKHYSNYKKNEDLPPFEEFFEYELELCKEVEG